MNNSSSISFSLRVFLGIAAVGIVLAFMQVAADMLNLILLAWIIVLVASPFLHWLRGKGAPLWLSFALTLLAILIVFLIFGLIMVVGANRFTQAIPAYADEMDNLMASIGAFFSSLGISQADIQAVNETVNPTGILDTIRNFLVGLVGTISNIVVLGLLVIFLLLEAFHAPEKLVAEIKAGNAYMQRLLHTSNTLRKYFVLTTIVGISTGILDTIWFVILGVPFPVLWGILAFLLSYVPTLGFWLAAIPPTLLTLLESGPAYAVLVFVGIVLINGFAENVIKPKYMGEGLNLIPLMIVFSVVFWGIVLGPLGAILGVPVTLLFKELIFEADEQNRWIAKLMSSSKSKDETADLESGG